MCETTLHEYNILTHLCNSLCTLSHEVQQNLKYVLYPVIGSVHIITTTPPFVF